MNAALLVARLRPFLASVFGLSCTLPGAHASAALRAATFARPTLYHLGSNSGTAFDVASGDFTGTGIKDIVVATGAGGSITLLAGKGDGTFSAPVTAYSSPGHSITSIAVGDFNDDGRLDLAATLEGSTQEVTLLLGDGHRRFRRSATSRLRFLNQSRPFPNGGIRSIAVGKFSRRGDLGVVVTDSVNYISVFPGDGKGGLGSRRDILAAALPSSLLVADLFGNGLSDIGLLDDDSASIYELASRGDETFAPRNRTALGALPVDAQPVSLSAGDFRGIGRTDLLAVYNATSHSGAGAAKVLLSDGHGSYARAADVRLADPEFGFPWAGAVADFNGDGIADLSLVVESFPDQNDVFVILGNGDGTFSTTAQTLIRVKFNPLRLLIPDREIVEDFNNDGKPDIAIAFDRTSGDGIEILLNTTQKGSPLASRSRAPQKCVTDAVAAALLGDGCSLFQRSRWPRRSPKGKCGAIEPSVRRVTTAS